MIIFMLNLVQCSLNILNELLKFINDLKDNIELIAKAVIDIHGHI